MLETAVESSGHDLYVVYGRRRVGKTELLKRFCVDRPHIYFLPARGAEARQREKFVEQIAGHFDERVPRIDGWDEAFEHPGGKLGEEEFVVVIDEFPYLVGENGSVPSCVQSFTDEQLQQTESMVVRCGSGVSTMESEVFGHESPLYGRRTGQIDLQPFSFGQAREAIATGYTTPNEVAGATAVDSGPLSKYLRTLQRLRLVEREVTVTASQQRSKRSRYRVADEFLRFWFRYVEPNRSSIEEAPEMVYEGTIEPSLPDHVATTFEDVCLEAAWEAVRRGRSDPYSEIGRWWYGEDEIDIVGLAPSDDRILLSECTWTAAPVGHDLVATLEGKAERVRWGPADWDERFALFSRSGFADGLTDHLGEEWSLFGVEELAELFGAPSRWVGAGSPSPIRWTYSFSTSASASAWDS